MTVYGKDMNLLEKLLYIGKTNKNFTYNNIYNYYYNIYKNIILTIYTITIYICYF